MCMFLSMDMPVYSRYLSSFSKIFARWHNLSCEISHTLPLKGPSPGIVSRAGRLRAHTHTHTHTPQHQCLELLFYVSLESYRSRSSTGPKTNFSKKGAGVLLADLLRWHTESQEKILLFRSCTGHTHTVVVYTHWLSYSLMVSPLSPSYISTSSP